MFTPLSCFYLKSQYGADWPAKAPIKVRLGVGRRLQAIACWGGGVAA